MAAKEFSTDVKPVLDKNNVRLVGIGFDTQFVKPFVVGGFFTGELYVDTEKECYKALQFQKFSTWSLVTQLASIKWLSAISKTRTMGISGDLKGDGFQNGGALVIGKDGQVLYEYRQEDASEQISADKIFEALKINNK